MGNGTIQYRQIDYLIFSRPLNEFGSLFMQVIEILFVVIHDIPREDTRGTRAVNMH